MALDQPRRDLLLSIAGFAALSLSGCVTKSKSPVAYGSKGKVLLGVMKNDTTSVVRLYDWDRGAIRDYPIPLSLPHAIVRMPSDPNVVFIFESLGTMARLNLESGEVLRYDNRAKDELFSGHGTWTANSDAIVCSEVPLKRGGRRISIRDPRTMAVIDEIEACRHGAHQILRLPGTNVVAWGDGQAVDGKDGGGVTFYDLDRSAVVSQVDLGSFVLHLSALSSTEVVTAGWPRNQADARPASPSRTSLENMKPYFDDTADHFGPVYLVTSKGESCLLSDRSRKDLFNHNFGLASLNRKGEFVSTHLRANKVLIWKDFAVESSIEVPTPTNVAVSDDGSELMILTARGIEIRSMATKERVRLLESPLYSTISAYKG